MKYLDSYKIFETLTSEFNAKVNSLISNRTSNDDKLNSGYQAKKMTKLLDSKLKQEFMYRVTDGEDIFKLIEEFVDRTALDPESQFTFRGLICHLKLKELEKEKTPGIDLIVYAERNGIDKAVDLIKNGMKEKFEKDEEYGEKVIDMIQSGIDYLEKTQKIFNWTFQRDQNINTERVELAKELIEKNGNMGRVS